MKVDYRALRGALCILLLVCAVAASGCGKASKGAGVSGSTPVSSQDSSGSSGTGAGTLEEDPVGKLETLDEKCAAREAIRHAADANTGSTFEVTDIRVADGWARVGLEETGVPREEAVGFGVYLRKLSGARWEVAASGTDVSPDELPDAPGEVFE